MLRGYLLLSLLFANHVFGGTVQTLPSLPNATAAKTVQVDSSGNIYLAGWAFPNPPALPAHAFVAKLTPDGSRVIWWTPLAGSGDDRVYAMALGSDSSVYVTGSTTSSDFPTTKGSMQPATTVSNEAFAAKLNPSGAVVYATYIGGSTETSGNAIAVDASGHAFISGITSGPGVFPTSPGAVTGVTSTYNGAGYVIELDAAGSAALIATVGFGGRAIAVDTQGNIYAAGSFAGLVEATTPGAFQPTTVTPVACFTGFTTGFYCTYQHVAKIDPTGTKLIYGTYLNGSFGATPEGMAVDADGNVMVAGSTNSPDYPTTPGAYQPEYFADPEYTFQPPHDSVAPVSAGYVTKLNASGSGLVWSTLFAGSGGSEGDTISGIAIDGGGNILLAGAATSSDLPGLWSTPVAARLNGGGFVSRLSPDGTTLSETKLIAGSTSVTGVAVRSDGSALVTGSESTVVSGVSQPMLSAVSVSAVGRVAAICDTADSAKIVRVAPGQLLTLYGANLAPAGLASAASTFPASLSGVTVTFNGIAAPILYTSGIQINLQVPYEVAGLAEVTMQVSSSLVAPPVSESYILGVAARQPSVFVSATSFAQPVFDETVCGGQIISGLQPLALNADGTQNSCANPAPSGSVVTIFLNGLGVSAPSQSTGVVSAAAVPISPAAGYVSGSAAATNFLSTATLPGSIDAIAQVQIRVTSASSPLRIPMEIQQASEAGYWIRGPAILIWVQ